MTEICGKLQGKKKALSSCTSATKLREVGGQLACPVLVGSHSHYIAQWLIMSRLPVPEQASGLGWWDLHS